jgi:hypothetical protein
MAVAIAAAAFAVLPALGAGLFTILPQPKAGGGPPQLLVAPVPVRMDSGAIAAAQPGSTFDTALPDGRVVTIRIDRLERHDNGDISWIGRVVDPARDDLTAIGTTGRAGTYAQIETAQGTLGIVPSGQDYDWLYDKSATDRNLPQGRRLDDAVLPPPHAPVATAKATCPTIAGMPTPQVTVDVLAVLAPDFVSIHGGAAAAETRLNNIFASINAYNVASNVAITYRRVATMGAAYQAASTGGDDDAVALDAITSGAGSFANVAAIRNFYGADMVALFRGPKDTGGSTISGMGWINGDVNGDISSLDAPHMYSVIGDWNFPDAVLPAHELGHNLGNNHDHPNASPSPSGATPYAYGYYICGSGATGCGQPGFNDMGTGFGTIMAYELPTVAKFSSPSLTCQSTRAGAIRAACGIAGQEDDVRSMNCVRSGVASIRASWVGNCANLSLDSDSDGIPDCLEAGSGRVNGAKDNDIFGNGLLFVAQQYRDFLAREADADGLNYWTGAVNSGATPRAQLAASYLESNEFQGTIAPVARLYFAYFQRVPDYAGLQYWIGRYKGGMSLNAISQQFAASAEFVSKYGALNNAQFVTLVYQNVLGRQPDASGLAFWTGQLDSAAIDRGSMMTQFSESAEYRGLIDHEVYVTMAYMGMLRRAPDSGGFTYWVGYMDSGNSGTALVASFVGSAEYHNRFLP